MPIIIDATLTEPPSSVMCFRDLTLYAKCFIERNVIVECEEEMQDIYWKWLKRYGAFDFVEDLVCPFSLAGFSVRPSSGNITVPLIDEINLNFIRSRLPLKQGPY